MNVSEFNYDLPPDRIAQTPIEPRDHAKMLVLDREAKTVEDRHVFDLPEYLKPGDLLVFNDSKVFKARLRAKMGSGATIEIFLLRPQLSLRATTWSEAISDGSGEVASSSDSSQRQTTWLALVKPGRKIRNGYQLTFEDGTYATVMEKHDDGTVSLNFRRSAEEVFALADRYGAVPTPPYVKTVIENPAIYQTVYAKHVGSVAAPTAGFHFTERLLEEIRSKGVRTAFVTLHVGLGTFRPIKTETLEQHEMHEEWLSVSYETMKMIEETKKNGGRVIAVGTTTVRALETAANPPLPLPYQGGVLTDIPLIRGTEGVAAYSGFTRLFITPGYKFKIIDGLVTNFHLPKSTLLILVSAFAGREYILRAYRHAIENDYRFYSFGDAMMIA